MVAAALVLATVGECNSMFSEDEDRGRKLRRLDPRAAISSNTYTRVISNHGQAEVIVEVKVNKCIPQ
jgi:hypothetical protein